MAELKLPRITLVTPSYNQGRYLAETIESVLAQNYPNLEYFVFDGGSTDGSREILAHYADRLDYWESAPDNGQSDAISKGFRRATGVMLNWLNSDDLLAPGALAQMAALYLTDTRAGIYAAAVENFTDGHFDAPREKSKPNNLDIESLLGLTGRIVNRHQPGIFFSRDLYELSGEVALRYHFCMDLDLHGRLLLAGGRVIYSDCTVAYFR